MPSYSTLRIDQDEEHPRIARLLLNRPERLNAINEEMAADVEEAATRIAERTEVRAVLIVGNGTNFTVGGDVNLFAGTAPENLPARLRRPRPAPRAAPRAPRAPARRLLRRREHEPRG